MISVEHFDKNTTISGDVTPYAIFDVFGEQNGIIYNEDYVIVDNKKFVVDRYSVQKTDLLSTGEETIEFDVLAISAITSKQTHFWWREVYPYVKGSVYSDIKYDTVPPYK